MYKFDVLSVDFGVDVLSARLNVGGAFPNDVRKLSTYVNGSCQIVQHVNQRL